MKRLLRNLLFQNSNIILISRSILFTAAIFVSLSVRSQQIANYVSNGSFESLNTYSTSSYYNVINYWQPIDTGKFSNYLATLRNPIANAPGAIGYQFPRTGDNYAISDFFCSTCAVATRGYLRNRLKQFLQGGKTYCVRFYFVNTNNTTLTTPDFGAYFAGSSIDTISKCDIPITYLVPQVTNSNGIITDTLNWVPITGTFVANGTEKYMIIGNFKSDANTNTVLINPTFLPDRVVEVCVDDVSCIDIDLLAYAGPSSDTWCIPGDSVYLGRPRDVGIDEACMWYKLPDMTNAIDTAAGLWVKPIVTTTYVVKQEICAGIKYDTIVVHQSGVGLQKHKKEGFGVEISPNPANNFITLVSSEVSEILNVQICDVNGKLLFEKDLQTDNSKVSMDLGLKNGIYFVTITNASKQTDIKKLIILR